MDDGGNCTMLEIDIEDSIIHTKTLDHAKPTDQMARNR